VPNPLFTKKKNRKKLGVVPRGSEKRPIAGALPLTNQIGNYLTVYPFERVRKVIAICAKDISIVVIPDRQLVEIELVGVLCTITLDERINDANNSVSLIYCKNCHSISPGIFADSIIQQNMCIQA
jgi:hypothetical protein